MLYPLSYARSFNLSHYSQRQTRWLLFLSGKYPQTQNNLRKSHARVGRGSLVTWAWLFRGLRKRILVWPALCRFLFLKRLFDRVLPIAFNFEHVWLGSRRLCVFVAFGFTVDFAFFMLWSLAVYTSCVFLRLIAVSGKPSTADWR